MQYRSEFKDSCVLVVNKNIVKVFDRDSVIIEYINNIESNKDIISFKYKYLDGILNTLRAKRINYIVIDSDINYQVYDYYFTEYNNYNKYLNLGRIFNKLKRKYIISLNKVYNQ